ncbi:MULTISPECIES: lasso peptide biosynthesis B2 protein [unclassified Brevundimonas]|jgi:hypothetical protein|uniref:lasso peptide biosynthesis B2 protein n=1 Tax=unclassified Brevundimonas TaxID=2622653 RepID=UPI000C458A1A|nr:MULTISPECIES: lasso peptide biosynthesis B2 protein [unclassified Brevundimonas]MAL88987.1 hypothetical protein [Brevundimonas sp.]HAJ02865.1 lasso peptide biosynthesis B2 protein [Brevundimonas sp.]|tara:strand:+ start:2980 stop:3468 length:489 start_codon:yes stop_codon:yes gene_type:complete
METMLLRKCRSASQLPTSLIALIPIAWFLIGTASIIVAVAPFRRITPLLGRNLGPAALAPVGSPKELGKAVLIARAIGFAARCMPLRSDCLPQAIAGVSLCRLLRVPYAAYFGASTFVPEWEGELLAHAWLQCGPVVITGGRGNFGTYGVVACFVAPDRRYP